jgi:hypothetical protein
VDLSQLLVELLHTDEEFVLYRGEYSNQPGTVRSRLSFEFHHRPTMTRIKALRINKQQFKFG